MIKTENKKIADSKDAEIENYKTTISNLEKKIEESPKSEELDSLKNEIQQMKDAEAQRVVDEKKLPKNALEQKELMLFLRMLNSLVNRLKKA